jgi:hypothetical protein
MEPSFSLVFLRKVTNGTGPDEDARPHHGMKDARPNRSVVTESKLRPTAMALLRQYSRGCGLASTRRCCAYALKGAPPATSRASSDPKAAAIRAAKLRIYPPPPLAARNETPASPGRGILVGTLGVAHLSV